MKNFMQKIQEAGKKAAEIKQALQGAPAKAAQLREAVAMTAGELHQLRADVQSNLTGLRAHNEQHLLDAMSEINDGTETLAEAGYELTGLDLDLALNQRLAVQLDKIEGVPRATLRNLLSKETRPTIKSILTGIVKAEETAETVDVTHLSYHGLIVHIGPTPAIRMCWRSEEVVEEVKSEAVTLPSSSPPPVPSAPDATMNSPVFGSYFEQRPVPVSTPKTPPSSPPPAKSSVGATPVTPPAHASAGSEKPSAVEGGGWTGQALDRFKKMPDLSKRAR